MAMFILEPSELREARERKGMTLKEFASKIGVSEGCLSRWENGKREPRLEMLLKISNLLSNGRGNGRKGAR